MKITTASSSSVKPGAADDDSEAPRRACAVAGTRQPPMTVCPHGCQTALEYALVTAPEARDPSLVRALDTVAGRVLQR